MNRPASMAEWKEKLDAGSTPEPNTGCWLWTGGAIGGGYGRLGPRHTPWGGYAHRAALWFAGVRFTPMRQRGEEQWVVRHLCDQPACVNPAHLAYGTDTDNARDRSRGVAWLAWLERQEASRRIAA